MTLSNAGSTEKSEFVRDISGRSVAVECVPTLWRQADWLLGAIEAMAKDGIALWNGEFIQIGWSMIRLRYDGAAWVACEPDFSRDPLREVRADVSCTLIIQTEQTDLLKHVGATPRLTSFQDIVLVGDGCLERSDVYLERVQPPTPGHSGWYIGPATREDVTSRRNLYSYELISKRWEILKALLLPVGYVVFFDGKEVRSVLNSENREVWSSSPAMG